MTDATSSQLISEIERYLAAVDVFRSEGCEPQWRSEEGLVSAALLHAPARQARR
jgi:hypothetical protein